MLRFRSPLFSFTGPVLYYCTVVVKCSQPGSILSEEVSEESITVEGGVCLCQHREDCLLKECGNGVAGPLEVAPENAGSVEVRDRLKELQGRVATLEQEKVGQGFAHERPALNRSAVGSVL